MSATEGKASPRLEAVLMRIADWFGDHLTEVSDGYERGDFGERFAVVDGDEIDELDELICEAQQIADIRGDTHMELSTDMSRIRCHQCGYELPYGTDLSKTHYCGGCGRLVVF